MHHLGGREFRRHMSFCQIAALEHTAVPVAPARIVDGSLEWV
jgi:hypothetical protein